MPRTEEFFKRLGRRIREIREAKGWKQKQISERGFNPNQWQQIESGDRGMNISTLLNVCEVLQTDLKTLLAGLDEGLYEQPDTDPGESVPPDEDRG